MQNPERLAENLIADIQSLDDTSTENQRRLRNEYSRKFREQEPGFAIETGLVLLERYGRRWLACEVVADHPGALEALDVAMLERFGAGMDSWDNVDVFGRLLSGPAWLRGVIGYDVIHRWARSGDLWWRRAALVSTVALNIKTDGGTGDAERTLAVCDMLLDDREEMVVKAMSWALRALAVREPTIVHGFVNANEDRLAARVKREVRNKLSTGLKNPGRKKG